MPRHRLRHHVRDRFIGIAGMLLLAASGAMAVAPAAVAGQPTGQVRLGHLSPTTPSVDITLSGPQGPDSVDQRIATGVGYGAVTDYLTLVPGRYSVQMRLAGSDPVAPAPLAAGLEVAAGTAETLLFFDNGSSDTARAELVDDDLNAPTPADGKVRLVQAAGGLPPLQALAVNGPTLATDLFYGTVTEYATVAARTWDVRLSAGGQTLAVPLPVGGGSVNTVVVTTDGAGKLVATPLVDVAGLPVGLASGIGPTTAAQPSGAPQAAGPAAPTRVAPARPAPQQLPSGGVPAGGGGSAPQGPGVLPILLALAGAPLLVFSLSSLRATRRRSSG